MYHTFVHRSANCACISAVCFSRPPRLRLFPLDAVCVDGHAHHPLGCLCVTANSLLQSMALPLLLSSFLTSCLRSSRCHCFRPIHSMPCALTRQPLVSPDVSFHVQKLCCPRLTLRGPHALTFRLSLMDVVESRDFALSCVASPASQTSASNSDRERRIHTSFVV